MKASGMTGSNSADKLGAYEKTIGYTFINRDYLIQALTHRSASPVHYERLEFLGDSILGVIIADELYHRFTKVGEGDLTRMRSTLVRESTLAEIARGFNLSEYLIMGPGELKSGGFRRESILADVVEATLAAVYLDSGRNFEKARELVQTWFSEKLRTVHPGFDQKDPKTQLQEYLQGRHHSLPVYRVVSITGEDHNQQFTVNLECTFIKETLVGYGSTRRGAEQNAAQKALDLIHARRAGTKD